MQTRTNLGLSLGQMLAGAFDNSAQKRGALDGMRANEIQSQIELQDAQRQKAVAETKAKEQEASYGTDDSLIGGLLSGIGANSEDGVRDFKTSLAGNYKPPVRPLAFTDGGMELPAPGYVSRFPELQQKFAALKQMLALGDKNIEHLSGSIRGDQRNAITANITPENAPRIALETAAIDGRDPTQITDASLVQDIANGGNYGVLAKALLASHGKGIYDDFNGGVTNVIDGTQTINGIGKSIINEYSAKASQANAGAKENLAQAVLAGVRGDSIKAGKGDGSQAKEKDFARIRDDIRADYNAMYPFNQIDGNRGKEAPDFNTFTKNWLKQYNIDENEFFRNTNPGQHPAATNNAPAQPVQLPAGVPTANKRVIGKIYDTPKGKMVWTGTGWKPAQ